MKTSSWRRLVGLALVCQLTLAACQSQQQEAGSATDKAGTAPSSKVLASKSSSEAKASEAQKSVDQSPFVVAIQEDGYLVLADGKTSFVKGKVPKKATFAPETLPPKDYQFDDKHVLYEVEKGYIIKVANQFYYYPKEKGANVQTAKLIPGVTVPTSDGFLLTDKSKITAATKEGLIVDHDGHSHFIFYADLQGTAFAHLIPSGANLTARPSLTTASGSVGAPAGAGVLGHGGADHHYTFNPADIVAEDEFGYTVRHDDHFHYILKSSLGLAGQTSAPSSFGSASNRPAQGQWVPQPATAAAELAPFWWQSLPGSSPGQPTVSASGVMTGSPLVSSSGTSQSTGGATAPVVAQPAQTGPVSGIDFPTSDGFLFDGTGVVGRTPLGLLVDHDGHLHLLLAQDLLASKWAHLWAGPSLATSSSVTQPTEGAQATAPNQSTPPSSTPTQASGEQVGLPEKPSTGTSQGGPDHSEPVAPAEVAQQASDLALKKAHLAQSLGLSLDHILDIETPSGPAFIYPHEDHSHVVLASQVDLNQPFTDGHDDHGHDHDHNHGQEAPSEPVVSENPSAVATSEGAASPAPSQPAQSTPEEPSVVEPPVAGLAPTEPVSEPATPVEEAHVTAPEISRVPELAPTADEKPFADDELVKRTYLSQELGLSPDQLIVTETPNGKAFIYPHGDHHHVVLLSQLDLTKPYQDGHDDHGHDHDHDHGHEESTAPVVSESPSAVVTSEESASPAPSQPAQSIPEEPSVVESPVAGPAPTEPVSEPAAPVEETPVTSPEISHVPELAPTADEKPFADDELVKRTYLSQELGLSPDQLIVTETPNGKAFIYPHGDHHHVVLLSQLDLTKPYQDGHDDHGHEESTAPVASESPSASVVAEVPASLAPSQPSQSIPEEPSVVEPPVAGPAPTETVSEPAAPVEEAPVTAPEISRVPELAPTADEKPLADEVLLKRTYLAKELGISPDSLVLIELADGKAFIYPHDTHHHVVSLGDLDITKPFDTGHGHHDHEAEKPAEATEQPAMDAPNSEETSPAREEEIPSETTTEEAPLAEEAVEAPVSVPSSEGDQASSQPEGVTSTNSAETEHQATSATKLTEEDKRDLTAYIRKTYGLLLGTPVTFHDDFVVFAIPHPHQDYDAKRDYYSDELDPAYDPGHVHPYAVPLAHLEVLKPTGKPELDFENELIAAAKRIGVSPSEVKIKDKKYFVLPGHDHDHYLNILTPREGYDAYMANKLPDIKPSFATGAFDKSAVTAEVDRIRAAAKDKHGEDSLDYRRVARVLEEFTTNLRTATTSTEAYVSALQSFEDKHLKGLETSPELANPEVDPYVARYTALTDQLKAYDERTIKAYGLNPDQLLNRLKAYTAAQDDAGLASVETHFAAINRAKKASSDLAPRLAYMDYFVRNLDSDKLPASLRQEVIAKLTELQKISGLNRNHQKFREGLADTALLKEKVQKALAVDGPAPDHANWEPYPRGFDRREIVRGINAMRDFVIRHNEIMPDELAAGFDKPLELFPMHPKKPSQPVAAPAQPKPAEQPATPEKEDKPADSPESATPSTDKDQAADTERPSAEAPATDADSADQGTSAGQPETSRDETDSESGAAPNNQADGAIETEGPVQPDEAPPSLDEEEEDVDPFEDFTTEELERLLEALNKRDPERQGESSAETAFDEFSPEELEKINAAINRLTEGNQPEGSDETSAGTASPEAPADQADRQPVGKETGSEEVSAPATEHDNHSSSTDEANRPEEAVVEPSTSSEPTPASPQPTESATDEGTSATASPEPAASDVSSDEPAATEEEPAPAPVEEAAPSPVLTDGPGEEEEDDWPALTWGGSIFNIPGSDGNDFDDWERPIDRPSRWSDDELPTWGGSIFTIPGGYDPFFDQP